MEPKTIAAAIPPEVAVNPPVKTPNRPFSSTAFSTPLANAYPNPVKGTVAPAPAKEANHR